MKTLKNVSVIVAIFVIWILGISLAIHNEKPVLEPLAQITLVSSEIALDAPIVEFYEDYSGKITYANFTLTFGENDNGEITLDEIWVNDAIVNIACDAAKSDNFANGQTCVLAGQDSIHEFLEKWLR